MQNVSMLLILAYVRNHNKGVRNGNFSAFTDLFAPQGEITFEGSSFGPFKGRASIDQAFRTNPPDQELELYNIEIDSSGGTVTYGWRDTDTVYGTFRVDIKDNLIYKVIVHDNPSSPETLQPVKSRNLTSYKTIENVS